MRQVKRLLPYVRRYVQMAVYDVLDAEGAEYRKEESGAVVARLSVYGNVSTFSLSTEIQDAGTGLTVSMREPCPGLSAQGEERAVTAVADKVAQYLENELMINRRCFVPDRHYAVSGTAAQAQAEIAGSVRKRKRPRLRRLLHKLRPRLTVRYAPRAARPLPRA